LIVRLIFPSAAKIQFPGKAGFTMAIRQLDQNTALVIVDFQEGTRRYVGAGAPAVYEAAGALAAAFRQHGLPVVLVNIDGSPPGRSDVAPGGPAFSMPAEGLVFVAELNQQPFDIVVTKRTWGAFASTDIETQLRNLGVTQVVVCGTAASIGVESTARQAFEAGFNVTVALDAVVDFNAEAHANSVTRIFPLLGETGTVADIVAELNKAR
jgi:nicotinamidase-related amidase